MRLFLSCNGDVLSEERAQSVRFMSVGEGACASSRLLA